MLRKRKGLTLVEIIVAMAVFAIVVATLLPAFIFVARLNIVSKAGVDVTAIAQQEAEKFYGYSRTNTYSATLPLAMAESVGYIQTQKTDNSGTSSNGKIMDILTRYDSANHATIVVTFWNNFPSIGMTKIRVIVSNDPGYNQDALPEQIDSILLFK